MAGTLAGVLVFSLADKFYFKSPLDIKILDEKF